jgi:TetR/AcrR family transcriptional regulator, transcriptional repressor for nem operon
MRVSNEEKKKSKTRILQAASRRFREEGIEGTSLSEIMQDAGMTHGGFYKHFEDKDALVRAALAHAFVSVLNPMADVSDASGGDAFRDLYLSASHRDSAGQGCPIAALACDVARADNTTRQVMTEGVEARVAQLQRGWTDAPEPRAAAIRDLAALVGAIVIARAIDGPLSDEVLAASRGGRQSSRHPEPAQQSPPDVRQ